MAEFKNEFQNKKNIVWVILSAAMALTIIVIQFLPGSEADSSMLTIYGVMLWCGIFGTTLWRYLGKSGWLGFAIGSSLGMVIQIISGFL